MEDDLDRMETDELLLQYKLDNSKKKINQEVNDAESDLKNRPALSDLLK